MASKEKLPNIFKRILERISKKLLVKFPKNNRKKFKLVAEELCFGVEWTFQKKKKGCRRSFQISFYTNFYLQNR